MPVLEVLRSKPADGWADAECVALSSLLYNHSDVGLSGHVDVDEFIEMRRRLHHLLFSRNASESSEQPVGDEAAERLRVAESLKERPWSPFLCTASWSDGLRRLCDKALVSGVSLAEFKGAMRRLLAKSQPGWPTISLGPVIGKATETTARILVELNHTSIVTCSLTPGGSEAPATSLELRLERGRPRAFVFTGLQPDTKYRVTFVGAVLLVDVCSFRTQPAGGWQLVAGHTPHFACVSCNDISTTRTLPVGMYRCDLWDDLAQRIREAQPPLDYMFHIGDNVYNDATWSDVEKGKKILHGSHCKWGAAHLWLDSLPQEKWAEHVGEVAELFRNVYRETWGHPPTRWVLANVPNLMILDDHEIRDDWGDRPEDGEADSLDTFLAKIAHDVYGEYQRQLYEDSVGPPTEDFHFHALGEVGLAFFDVRSCKGFYQKPIDRVSPFLGVSQWRALEDALSPDSESAGVFGSCKALIALVPEPVAYISETPTFWLGHYTIDDLLGMFSAPDMMPEVSRLLQLLQVWRDALPGREVLLVCGDVHEGGWTDLMRHEHLHPIPRKRDPQLPRRNTVRIRQLCTSAMAAPTRSPIEAMLSMGARDVLSVVDGWGLGGGWWYRHCAWDQRRNYALLDVSLVREQVVIGGRLVCGGVDGASVLERRTTSDPAFSRVQGFCSFLREVGSNFGGMCGHLSSCCKRRAPVNLGKVFHRPSLLQRGGRRSSEQQEEDEEEHAGTRDMPLLEVPAQVRFPAAAEDASASSDAAKARPQGK